MEMPISDEAIYRYRWWGLIGLGMTLVILNFDLTIVNLALPLLGREFHAKLSMLQWISNIYSLTFAALVVLTGKVADRYGHRLIYLTGVVFFFFGSLIAGFAPNITIILLGRMFQGIGMAGTFGMIFVLASMIFPENQRGLSVGLLVSLVGVSQAIGPTVGGFIVEHWGWPWAFLINLPFCIISFILVYGFCQDKMEKKRVAPIHYPSAILLIVTYAALVMAFNEVQHWGMANWKFWLIIIPDLAIFFSVLFWQTKLATPFLDLKLFHHRVYRAVNITRPLFQFNFGAFFFVLPLYLQNIAGMSPGASGLVMLIMTLSLAISSMLVGRLNDHISPAGPIIMAHILSTIGFATLAITPITPLHWLPFSIALICIGVNIGIMYSTTNYAAIHSLPPDKKGVGYGFFIANAYLFYSIGIAMTGYLLSTIGTGHLTHLISHHIGSNSALLNDKTLTLYTNGARPVTALTTLYQHQGKILEIFARNAFARGFSMTMWLFTCFSLLGLIFCLAFRKGKDPSLSH